MRRIGKRLDAWEAGRHKMLVEDTLLTCEQYFSVVCREESEEHRAQTYQSLVLRGGLRAAVRWITNRETGGALQPGERCKKKGGRVMKVLRTNHLESRTPTAASLDSYPDRPPDIFPVDITNDTVTAVVWRLL